MSRFKFLALVAAFSLTACKPGKGTASPDDYTFLISTALQGAEIASMIGRNEAIKSKNFAGCVTAEVFGESAKSVNDAFAKRMGEDFVIPAVSIDLDDCMPLSKGPGPQSREEIAGYVEAFSGVALTAAQHYASKLLQTDCRKGTAALGAVAYLQGLVKPVASEIALPDGIFEASEVKVSLSECAE